MYEDDDKTDGSSRRHRGAKSLGEDAEALLGECDAAGAGIGAVAQEQRLREWAEANGHVVPQEDWEHLKVVSAMTAEHEVRYRPSDNRAVKKTWPGMFGFVPKLIDGAWKPAPATPLEYLRRQKLQNVIFNDDVRVEGLMTSDQPSMLIGQPSGGLSIVISQPWMKGLDDKAPHPSEKQIAAYLQSRGFSLLFSSFLGWRNATTGVVVLDAKPDNFILTERGILPIDLLLTHTQPDET